MTKKTAAFLVPVLGLLAGSDGPSKAGGPARLAKERAGGGGRPFCKTRVNRQGCRPSALVLAPTRELAQQIETECSKLCYEAPP